MRFFARSPFKLSYFQAEDAFRKFLALASQECVKLYQMGILSFGKFLQPELWEKRQSKIPTPRATATIMVVAHYGHK